VTLSPTGIASTVMFGNLFVGTLWPFGGTGTSGTWIPASVSSVTVMPGGADGLIVWVPESDTAVTVGAGASDTSGTWTLGT
jgi:hypothetical protein